MSAGATSAGFTSTFGAFGKPTAASSAFGSPSSAQAAEKPKTSLGPVTTGYFGGNSTSGQMKPGISTDLAADYPLEQSQQHKQQPNAEASTSTSETGTTGEPNSIAEPQSSKLPASPFPDPGTHVCLELLLRKLLLGEDLINTHFHLFSAKSFSEGRIRKPRVIFANDALLAKGSKYFLDMLSSDIDPSDPSLSDLAGGNDVPSESGIDEYGYASDSDLDECDDPMPEISKDQSVIAPSKVNTETRPKDEDELSDDGSESVTSDMFVMSSEDPRTGEILSVNLDASMSTASGDTVVQETASSSKKSSANRAAIRLRSLGGRQILVKDTAYQTWYALLNYISTGKVIFLPLSSTISGVRPRKLLSSTTSLDEPKCSAKSMYRLASKVGLDRLRDEALTHIRNSLTEHNILKEISSSLVSKHPQLLEMELDMLYSYIASPPVAENFPDLVRRIINKELPHGADIIIKTHEKFVRELRPALPPTPPQPHTLSLQPASPLTTAASPPQPDLEPQIPVEKEVTREKASIFGFAQKKEDVVYSGFGGGGKSYKGNKKR